MDASHPAGAGPAGTPKKILIIDDSQIALLLASEALESAGYDVKTVLYPAEVRTPLMEIVDHYHPHLILTDVDMPLLRGEQFVKILRATPRLAGVKIYFHSSQRMEDLVHHVQSARADGYIQKSSDTGYLLERIRAALA